MDALRFELDSDKAAENLRKHGIAFAEAETAFFDDHAKVIPDRDHSALEERFILLGMSASLRVLVVVHCLGENGDQIRLISARKATPRERLQYSTPEKS